MSQSRSWSLTQEANNLSGVCSACRATRQLHINDGTVHNHGPRANPYPDSHKPPLSVSKPSVRGGLADSKSLADVI